MFFNSEVAPVFKLQRSITFDGTMYQLLFDWVKNFENFNWVKSFARKFLYSYGFISMNRKVLYSLKY